MDRRPIRTLLFSTLYPSSVRPGHGIFVETRLLELLRSGQVQTEVVAPVPWFPFGGERWGARGRMARTPKVETRAGLRVHHPRYSLLPKVGMTLAPLGLALGALPTLRRIRDGGFDFDVIDAHYYYPDGVAAALLAGWLGKPLVITARGSDLNLIPQHAAARRMIRWAAGRADASIGVCQALVDVLRRWDVDAGKLHVMRNGVDLDRFRPLDRDATRAALRVDGTPLLLSVGNLIASKGHHLAIEALPRILRQQPGARLAIVGDGPDRERLQQLAAGLGLAGQVRLVGSVAQSELARWYSAADLLILASQREGWANVLLEAMACGTPVVATRTGGTPEVVADGSGGTLLERRDADSLAAAVLAQCAARPARAAVRAYAEGYGWQETSDAQLRLFRRLAPAPETGRA